VEPRIIKTAQQHREAHAEVERLARLDPAPESPDGLRLELLSKLVEDYEKAQFVFMKPDPVDAILFRMEQLGLRQKDIAPLLGGKNRASEVLARKRRWKFYSMIFFRCQRRSIIPLIMFSNTPVSAQLIQSAAPNMLIW